MRTLRCNAMQFDVMWCNVKYWDVMWCKCYQWRNQSKRVTWATDQQHQCHRMFYQSEGRATWTVQRATWELPTIAQVYLRHWMLCMWSIVPYPGYDVTLVWVGIWAFELIHCCPGHEGWTAAVFSGGELGYICQMESFMRGSWCEEIF